MSNIVDAIIEVPKKIKSLIKTVSASAKVIANGETYEKL